MQRPFRPSPHAANGLIVLGFAALLYAFYLRYFVIESGSIRLACEGGLSSTTCLVRRGATELFRNEVFGALALAAAAWHLWRPRIALFAVALVLAAFGLVLYNNGLAALAVGLLVMSFARPAPSRAARTPRRERRAPRKTTKPASSPDLR
jgi:hypothetical protein